MHGRGKPGHDGKSRLWITSLLLVRADDRGITGSARDDQRGTTAVASISTFAAFSTRRTTWTSAMAG
jgi:hypothetical protein